VLVGQRLEQVALRRAPVAAADQDRGQVLRLFPRPRSEGGDELGRIDEATAHREQAKTEIVVSDHVTLRPISMAAGEPAIESPVVGIEFIMIWRRP
jgi:hypothetical protein